MKKRKVTIEHNEIEKECYYCNGTGFLNRVCNEGYACDACPVEECVNRCNICGGTGIYIDDGYIVIDEENKIAFDMDTLK